MRPPTRVGISGTGFVARGVFAALARQPDFAVTGVLTRRPVGRSAAAFPEALLTNSIDALVEAADVVFECSGDTLHAAEVLLSAGEAGRRLVTLCAEAQVTVGTALVLRGHSVTEAHGDQPGAFAALAREARAMDFQPLAYVNLKGFHDPDPSPESMAYWAGKQRITLRAVTSYTDGSKMQIEQVLVANGLGARIARPGLLGGEADDLAALDRFADAARALGAPISDYVVHPAVKGVVLLADNPVADLEPDFGPFAKLRTREGRAYALLKPYYLVHLEAARTLREVVAGPAAAPDQLARAGRHHRRRRQAPARPRHADRDRARRLRAARRGGGARRQRGRGADHAPRRRPADPGARAGRDRHRSRRRGPRDPRPGALPRIARGAARATAPSAL